MCVHVCSGAQSCPAFATLWTVAYQAPLSMGFPIRASQVAVNAGDVGSISGSERFPGEGNGKPRTEEPGGLQSMGFQRVGHDLTTEEHTHMSTHTNRHIYRQILYH